MIVSFLINFIRFFIAIIITILLHELGHLIIAKKVGCGVDVFSLGFGRAIWKRKIGTTLYQIAWIPLGGYCKLHDELIVSNDKNSFTNLVYHKKILITIAGCVVNVITGIMCFVIGLNMQIFNLYYFGAIGLSLGIVNLLPIPALDGSYPFLVLLEKVYGKEKGYNLMEKICKIGFIIIMTINILYLPYLFHLLWIGAL